MTSSSTTAVALSKRATRRSPYRISVFSDEENTSKVISPTFRLEARTRSSWPSQPRAVTQASPRQARATRSSTCWNLDLISKGREAICAAGAVDKTIVFIHRHGTHNRRARARQIVKTRLQIRSGQAPHTRASGHSRPPVVTRRNRRNVRAATCCASAGRNSDDTTSNRPGKSGRKTSPSTCA